MSKLKGKIDFKEGVTDAYDGQKLPSFYFLDEMGQWPSPDPKFNLQESIKRLQGKRISPKLKFEKSKKKYRKFYPSMEEEIKISEAKMKDNDKRS